MNHNGYNEHCKKGLGSVKIRRYLCPICKEPLEESRSFWEQLKTDFSSVLENIYQRFRIHNVSYDGISAVMELIFPRGKDTTHNDFTNSIEILEGMVKEEQMVRRKGDVKYMAWLKSNMSIFWQFVHERELKRGREDENLEQRPFFGAVNAFATLMVEIDSFEAFVQKRLRMIKKNWKHFTEFYYPCGFPEFIGP
uniref:Uncharacterized protein n=1 Tax=Candidatus Methanogaster sp. ANME-2c ERB4 TaxID=2759911 RepID=A0A7G9YF21_9EURY|nr:hypothetical protein OEAKOMNL_00006 [Methanosarcinales archaeon ANME-2c ERB4]